MTIYPNIQLIGQPDNALAMERLAVKGDALRDMLVVYDADLPFLERVLQAAGYDKPEDQLFLLQWSADDQGLDLARLIRQLKVKQVLLFGQDARQLGLHFQVAHYFPVEVAGISYLLAPSASAIVKARDAGNNVPAGALWQGIKSSFLRSQPKT